MDAATLQSQIRTKLADGFLPTHLIPRVFGGPGTGARCDACEAIILGDDLEIEADLPKGGVVRFHLRCFTIWQKEREAEEGKEVKQPE